MLCSRLGLWQERDKEKPGGGHKVMLCHRSQSQEIKHLHLSLKKIGNSLTTATVVRVSTSTSGGTRKL